MNNGLKNLRLAMPHPLLFTTLLLIAFNAFMTFAWYFV